MNIIKYVYSWILCIVSTGNLLGQTSVEEDAILLRKTLAPYFVPVEVDEVFLARHQVKIALGKQLFYDVQLSKNSQKSCNSCHDLKQYGTRGSYYLQQKERNEFYRDVPTVYNVGNYTLYNADGGIDKLDAKITESLLSIHEMGLKEPGLLLEKVKKNKTYQTDFAQAFPGQSDPITFEKVVAALSFFLQGLKTVAPIDLFLQGKLSALTPRQIAGGKLFVDKSCYSCHTGSNIGGEMIQKLGVIEEWPNQKDLGYYQIEKKQGYQMFFRVAPLRNVEMTSPYFHDACSKTLEQAIELMGIHERSMRLTSDEIGKIKEFLKALTGILPEKLIK